MKRTLLYFLFATLAVTAIAGCKKQEKEDFQTKEDAMISLAKKKVVPYDEGEKIVYKTFDGQELKTINAKESYSYDGEIPTKHSDDRFNYDFAGWDVTYSAKEKATIAKAKYEKTLREYEVRFMNSDDEVINTQMVKYGQKPVVPEGFIANEKVKEVFQNTTYRQKAMTRGGSVYTDGLIFEVLDGKSEFAVINYYGEDEHVDIPSIYSGLPVTTIAADAFLNAPHVKTIAIPNSITHIEPYAFRGMESFESFILEEGNTVYALDPTGAIYYNEYWHQGQEDEEIYPHLLYVPSGKVDLLEISENYFSIKDGALDHTNATILKVSASAFLYCDYIFGENNNNNVKQLIFTSGYIGDKKCENMTNLYSVTIYAEPEDDEEYKFGDYIGNAAFKGCTNLRGISIPSQITSLGAEAFMGCSSLEDVTLSFGDLVINSIGKDCFTGCENIRGYLHQGVVFLGNETHKYQIPVRVTADLEQEFVVPADTLTIPDYLFEKNQTLTDVNFEQCERLISIGEKAFYQCSVLDLYTEKHYLPATLEDVGYKAFTGTKYDPEASDSSWLWVRDSGDDYKYCCVNLLKNCGGFVLGKLCKFIDPYALRNGFDTISIGSEGNSKYEVYKSKILAYSYHIVRVARDVTIVNTNSFNLGNYPYLADVEPYCCYKVPLTSFGLLSSNENREYFISRIGEYAFSYCHLNNTLKFNNNLEYIGEKAFFNGIYASVTLKIYNKLAYAGDCAFVGDYRFTLKFQGSQIPETWDKNFDGKQGVNTGNTYLFNQTM